LKRLEKKSKRTFYYGEYKSAVRTLEGTQAPYDFTEMWEEPVEKWLPSRWKMYKDCNQAIETANALLESSAEID